MYSNPNFVELYFSIYLKVLEFNSKLNGQGIDKNLAKDISSTIYISMVNKNIYSFESDDLVNVEIPHMQHLEQPAPDNSPHKYNDKTLATDGQVKAIRGLLNDSRVNNKERSRIEALLSEPELSKTTAGDILSYFYGNREKKNGRWTKVSAGVLDNRQPQVA